MKTIGINHNKQPDKKININRNFSFLNIKWYTIGINNNGKYESLTPAKTPKRKNPIQVSYK